MNRILAIAKLLILEIFRKKDFYVAFIFTGIVLFYAARLRFYNVSNAYRYLLDIGLGLGMFFASILTVSLAARQFPSEVRDRTLHALLSKPVSRGQFVMGKFLGSFFSGAIVFLLFFGVILVFALSKDKGVSWIMAAQTYYLFCLSLMILTALATFFSFFMSSTANTSLTLTLFILISVYGATMRKVADSMAAPLKQGAYAVYSVIPHFGLFDMRQRFIHDWEPASLKIVFFLTVYACIHSALFLTLGWRVFSRKNIP